MESSFFIVESEWCFLWMASYLHSVTVDQRGDSLASIAFKALVVQAFVFFWGRV